MKIAFLLIGEIKYDGRVSKEINTLQKHGFEVELIVSKFNNDSYNNYNFKIYNLNIKYRIFPIINIINKFIILL